MDLGDRWPWELAVSRIEDTYPLHCVYNFTLYTNDDNFHVFQILWSYKISQFQTDRKERDKRYHAEMSSYYTSCEFGEINKSTHHTYINVCTAVKHDHHSLVMHKVSLT